MVVLLRSFMSAAALLAMATLSCTFLAYPELQTGPTTSALLAVCIALLVLLAGGGVLAGVFLQRMQNYREAAFRETCVAMRRKPGEPMTPTFLQALDTRKKQLARAKQKTPSEQNMKFAADVLACTFLGFVVDTAFIHFLPGEDTGLHRHVLAVFRVLPGLFVVSLCGIYKLHLVNRIKDLRLLQTMVQLRLAELSEEEATRRKDLWVSQYLSRTLLQIVYEQSVP